MESHVLVLGYVLWSSIQREKIINWAFCWISHMVWLEDCLLLLVRSSLLFQSSLIAYFHVTQGSFLHFGGLSHLSFTFATIIWPMNLLLWLGALTPFRWFSSLLSCYCLLYVFTQACSLVSFAHMFGEKGKSKSKRTSLLISKFSVLHVTINTNIRKDLRSNRRNPLIFRNFCKLIGQIKMKSQNTKE